MNAEQYLTAKINEAGLADSSITLYRTQIAEWMRRFAATKCTEQRTNCANQLAELADEETYNDILYAVTPEL